MPRKARSPEEVRAFKQKILDTALDLISEDGYRNFSMRKLAERLKITATPIYGYYKNKDELYLSVLTQGFDRLHGMLVAAHALGTTPMERLVNVLNAFIRFGLDNSNFYSIMLVLDVPKYNDYVGTSNQEAAASQLAAATRVRDFGVQVIRESGLLKGRDPEAAAMASLELICSIHGVVSIANNKIADYLLPGPDAKIDQAFIARFVDTLIARAGNPPR